MFQCRALVFLRLVQAGERRGDRVYQYRLQWHPDGEEFHGYVGGQFGSGDITVEDGEQQRRQ